MNGSILERCDAQLGDGFFEKTVAGVMRKKESDFRMDITPEIHRSCLALYERDLQEGMDPSKARNDVLDFLAEEDHRRFDEELSDAAYKVMDAIEEAGFVDEDDNPTVDEIRDEPAFGEAAEDLRGLDAAFEMAIASDDLHIGRFRVHLVFPGDRYGLDDRLVYEKEEADERNDGGPLVEFYDESQDEARFPGGQFVSRYYSKDTASHEEGCGLSLYGGVPSWTLNAAQMDAVKSWMQERIQAHEQMAPRTPRDARVSVRDEGKAAADAAKALSERSRSRDDHAFKTYGIER